MDAFRRITRRELLRRGGRLGVAAAVTPPIGWLTARSSRPRRQPNWQHLANRLKGRLLLPGSPRYDTSAQPWNRRYARVRPAAIAQCVDSRDAREALLWAREEGVPFRLIAGGHSPAGYSTTSHLSIDVSGLHAVSADPVTGIVTVGIGATNRHLFQALPPVGLGLPHGDCPTNGIAGYTLGGGVGYTSRALGTLSDTLVETEIVVASGDTLTCSSAEHADLFWACRGGGGGNFGVNVSYKFQARPMPASRAVFRFEWSPRLALEAIRGMQEVAVAAPDGFGCQIEIAGTPTGSTGASVSTLGSYLGPLTELEQLVAPLLRGAPPSKAITKELSNAEAIRFLASDVSSPRVAIKTSYSVGAYPEAAVASFLDRLRQPPGGQGSITIIALGGAINRTAAGATAYVHRTADFLTLFRTTWPEQNTAGRVATRIEWLHELFASAQPYALPESYQNFTDPALSSWQTAYYGTNLPDLVRIKNNSDPDNVFHFPQSIPLRL